MIIGTQLQASATHQCPTPSLLIDFLACVKGMGTMMTILFQWFPFILQLQSVVQETAKHLVSCFWSLISKYIGQKANGTKWMKSENCMLCMSLSLGGLLASARPVVQSCAQDCKNDALLRKCKIVPPLL